MNYSAMVSILVSIILFPLVPTLHIVARWMRKQGLAPIIVVYLGAWLAVGWWLRTGEFFTVDYILAGVGTIGFLVLGYLEFFSMLCRGFSLQIIADVFERRAATKEEIIAHYGGKGVDWMFDKRIATMEKLEMVVRDNTTIAVLRHGIFVGHLGLIVKQFLKIGKGG